MSVSWEALKADIIQAAPAPGQPGSDLFWELIHHAKHAAREGDITMAKPKAPPPKGGGKDDGKTGKHHGGYLHGNAKTESTGKHGKGGGKK